MTFELRFALVLLGAFALSTAATSLTARMFAGVMLRASAGASAKARAWILASYRLLPAAGACALTAAVLGPGYYRHEQRAAPEDVGFALALLAAAGGVILAAAIARAIRAIRQTSTLRRRWLAAARPVPFAGAGMPSYVIDTPFPLVAVLGVFRPRLFVSSSVVAACSPDQIAAIVEHERSHVAACDNAVRLLMDAAPDALGGTRASATIADAWHQAVEHRADDAAARRFDLASALVRVARLAGEPGPATLPASALYRGEGIEDRVRRLVESPPAPARAPVWTLGAAALTLTLALAASAASTRIAALAHALLEAAVSLP